MENRTQIGPMLLSDNKEENLLLMDTVRLGITNQSAHAEEAKEFLVWLVSSKEAVEYQKKEYGYSSGSREILCQWIRFDGR